MCIYTCRVRTCSIYMRHMLLTYIIYITYTQSYIHTHRCKRYVSYVYIGKYMYVEYIHIVYIYANMHILALLAYIHMLINIYDMYDI